MMKSNARQNRKAASLYRQQPLFPLSTDSRDSSGTSSWECQVVAVGKRRDGGTRYWCLRHKADSTAKYGKPAIACRASHITPIGAKDRLELNIDDYSGGIALWGAVPPVYDTTTLPMDRGIHVHARAVEGGKKEMDRTVRAVQISGGCLPKEGIPVSELDAIYFMVTSIFGYGMKHITCSYCDYPHLDRDWFSVHPHRRHLCAGCGRYFLDNETAIGNPISRLRNICGVKTQNPKPPQKKLCVQQTDYPGGIQIWGSNPAFLWTSELAEEEGIHVHAFRENGQQPKLDDTYSQVTIDGVNLDPEQVRTLMAQMTLPFLKNRVLSLNCPSCGEELFGFGELAITPVAAHKCKRCGHQSAAAGRLRKTIANPQLGALAKLARNAPRQLQRHELNLMAETF